MSIIRQNLLSATQIKAQIDFQKQNNLITKNSCIINSISTTQPRVFDLPYTGGSVSKIARWNYASDTVHDVG